MSTLSKLLDAEGNGKRVTSERITYAFGYLAAQDELPLGIVLVNFRRDVWVAVCDGYVAGRTVDKDNPPHIPERKIR